MTQFALLSKYKITPKLEVGGQAIYQSEFYAGHYVENATGYRSVDYWRFDAMAEYKFNENWSAEILGTNLTDETYYDAIYQGANAFAYVAPGRAGYLTVKYEVLIVTTLKPNLLYLRARKCPEVFHIRSSPC